MKVCTSDWCYSKQLIYPDSQDIMTKPIFEANAFHITHIHSVTKYYLFYRYNASYIYFLLHSSITFSLFRFSLFLYGTFIIFYKLSSLVLTFHYFSQNASRINTPIAQLYWYYPFNIVRLSIIYILNSSSLK